MKVINRLAKGSSLHSCEPMRSPGLAGCRPAEMQPKGTPHLSQLRNAHAPDSPSSADYSVWTRLPFDMLMGLVLLALEIDYAGHDRGTVINSGLFPPNGFRVWSGSGRRRFRRRRIRRRTCLVQFARVVE